MAELSPAAYHLEGRAGPFLCPREPVGRVPPRSADREATDPGPAQHLTTPSRVGSACCYWKRLRNAVQPPGSTDSLSLSRVGSVCWYGTGYGTQCNHPAQRTHKPEAPDVRLRAVLARLAELVALGVSSQLQ